MPKLTQTLKAASIAMAAFALPALPAPAAAQSAAPDPHCDALWFTRNLVFDRAGYCFASPLGQAVFSADCSTAQPDLDSAAQALVGLVRQEEEMWECRVDTSRISLEARDIHLLPALRDLPVPAGYESACFGWRGAALTLRDARDPAARVSGRIEPGDDILLGHIDVDGWTFISMTDTGQGLGWLKMPQWTEDICDGFAG